MKKVYAGQNPRDGDWKMLDQFDADGVSWLMWEKNETSADDLRQWKIVAQGLAPKKANYWLLANSLGGVEKRGRCYFAMAQHRPELMAQIEKVARS